MNQQVRPEPLAIGIVGGMSPQSTIAYYKRVVRRHFAEYKDHSYPRMVMASVSFQRYVDWQHAGEWERIAQGLGEEFRAVAAAGAAFAILATNTMHKVLPQVQSPIPVLHIVDAIASHARRGGISSVGLTGTGFTMSDGFYTAALEDRGLSVVLPTDSEKKRIHEIIYDELIRGEVRSESVTAFGEIRNRLLGRGAGAVLLGCTELAMLVEEGRADVIDSTRAHADAAWEIAVGKRTMPPGALTSS